MILQNTIPLAARSIQTEDMLGVVRAFQKTNSTSLAINSNGSSIGLFFEFSNCINQREVSVVGHEQVASLAVLLFLCGKRRFATPNTTFLIHEARMRGHSGREVVAGEAQMQALICHLDNDLEGYDRWMEVLHTLSHFNQIAADFISKKTSLSRDVAAQLMHQEHEFDVDSAMKCGIIHDVIQEQQIHVLH